jgi:RNA polymerase sigma-70 factor (ECF subfamily)
VQSDISGRRHGPVDDFDRVLAGARAGDPAAWHRLYTWLSPAVAGYLRLRGAADVDDVTSEVFLAVFRKIATFEGTADNFRSWVFVIAHRRLLDERRRRSRRGDHTSLDGCPEPAATADVEAAALRTLATERVQALCADLSPDQADVLLLRIVGDLTVDQVAQVLGRSPGAVKQLQRRGFETLRRLLEREGVTL